MREKVQSEICILGILDRLIQINFNLKGFTSHGSDLIGFSRREK